VTDRQPATEPATSSKHIPQLRMLCIYRAYYVARVKTIVVTRRINFLDDIFICFDTILACDIQARNDSNSRAMQCVARVKTIFLK